MLGRLEIHWTNHDESREREREFQSTRYCSILSEGLAEQRNPSHFRGTKHCINT